MNTEIKFIDGKFVGLVNGKVVVKSASKYYVQRQLDGQSTAFKAAPAPVESEFGINKRFEFLEQMVTMIADGNGDFSKALGLTFDGSAYGMGIRGQRFSMIVRDGKVAELNIEPPGAFGVSSAEHLLGQLA
jgi:hypothetical protein